MDRAQPGQRRCQYGVRGAPPLRSKQIAKNREKEAKNQEKSRKREENQGKKSGERGKIGTKRQKSESFFTLPLLTDINAGYATEPGSAGAGPGVPEMARKIEEIIKMLV